MPLLCLQVIHAVSPEAYPLSSTLRYNSRIIKMVGSVFEICTVDKSNKKPTQDLLCFQITELDLSATAAPAHSQSE